MTNSRSRRIVNLRGLIAFIETGNPAELPMRLYYDGNEFEFDDETNIAELEHIAISSGDEFFQVMRGETKDGSPAWVVSQYEVTVGDIIDTGFFGTGS